MSSATKKKFCIDPGHGGKDPGAVGPGGTKEANVVLSISRYLASNLESIGVSTKLTRASDVFVELNERCKIANDWGADYFVSVHANSDGTSVTGIETLYKTNNGMALATPIQAAMVAATGDTNRGLKQRSDLAVLNGTKMPATLAEVGFISNPTVEAKLKTDAYQQTLASAITTGIARFLAIPEPTPPPPDPPVNPSVVTLTIEASEGVSVNVVRK